MDTNDYRAKIDAIDEQLVDLFGQRMEICGEMAEYKKDNKLPILDIKREREKLQQVAQRAPEDVKEYTQLLYSVMFDLSRSYQNKKLGTSSELTKKIKDAIENTPKLLPAGVSVACQGVEGANSHLACEKLLKNANIMFFSTFDAVFTAIEKGLCRYGVIPVENSTAGTVNSVYDLMMHHNFSIVRSIRLRVEHNLLANPGAKLSDIKEIYSHEQAINQCSKFLGTLEGVKIIPCANTAAAAKMVAESGRNDIAALSSRACMRYYGLNCLKAGVQDNDNNYTRFICISKELEIYPGADRTSLMATLPHQAGSLYKMLARLYALDINLNKLESRPLPGREFEFMFYFDLDTPVYSEQFLQLIEELSDACEEFTYLGSYSEVI